LADFLAKLYETYDLSNVVFAWSSSDNSNTLAKIIENINNGKYRKSNGRDYGKKISQINKT